MIQRIGTYKLRAYAFLIFSLIVLVGSFTYLYLARIDMGTLQQEILTNEQIMTSIHEANVHLLRAETAERGYIISGNEWFLNNFLSSDSSFHVEIDKLNTYTDILDLRAPLIQKLDSIGQHHIAHLKGVIEVYEKDGKQAASEMITEGSGKQYMDEYIRLSDQLATVTLNRINQRKANLSQLYYFDLKLTILIGIIASILLTTLFIYFYRSQHKMAAYNQQLESRNRDLQQFSYIASHDLKEPLRMVRNFLQLLEKKYKGQLDEKADQYIHFAVDGAKRMQRMIDDLLEYSRVGRKNTPKTTVDFNTLLQDVEKNIDALINENEAVIILESDLPEIPVYKQEMIRVFQNLISNAIKFRKPKVSPEVKISSEERKANWLFRVSDNGIGIPDNKQKEIFEIFQRLHSREEYTGTGIGLAISKKIIERHGGKIWVESEVNSGTTFLFTLPKN